MTPEFYMFAGINGAGKSTLYSTLAQTNSSFTNIKRANADEISRKNHLDWHNSVDNFKAMKIEMQNVHRFIKEKKSFNMETTLASSKKAYLNLLNLAKENGFTTSLLYVGVDSPEVAKERVKSRVSKGGHGIPNEVIDRRYPKSLKNLEQLAPCFDNIVLYDNTKDFKTIYKRERDQNITYIGSIKWAQECIKADCQALHQTSLQQSLLQQQLNKSRGLDR
ncbi:ATPase [Lactobacillus sp. ESL0233]|uniref:zeta toxin family protein n=1 Tax=Lactobacillus sp. ESL0233 TaxID=2069354 RepID=UPI000EFAD663|nr:zeta toxin family protein [Lactobacillus sp. ESL0233]RMC39068.1 ATPase [Lactobacillus sp. ESL0233]